MLSGCFHEEETREVKKEAIPVTNEYGGKELKKVGQSVKEKGWGILTLEQLKHINQTFEVPPMKVHVQDVKVIELSQMSQEAKDTLKGYIALSPEEVQRRLGDHVTREDAELYASLSGKEIEDEIRYVEISYKVENSGEKDMQFFSMNDVVINKGQHFNVPNQNFLYTEDTLVGTKSTTRADYKPGEMREGMVGLILEDKKEITTIDFTTDVLATGDTHETVAEPQTFSILLTK